MIKSIQQFGEIGINILGKVIEKFLEEPENHANFIYGVTESVTKLGLSIIAETLEEMDKELCLSSKRKQNWSIVKRDETTLLTSLGNVTYKKTLFIQKQTRERVYLLDKVMELKSHARMTEDVEARILEEAVESSYRKGGKNASITDGVSKQTVKNKIHQLEFPKIEGEIGEKKKVKILHINADEDHVSAQFYEKKGDIQKKEGRKYNTFMPKMVYLYEDVVPETDSVKVSKPRYRLKNVHYFGGMYEGKGNASLWEEVELYIEEHYDVSCLEKVYLCGDGANWIKSGCEYIDKSVFVLDRFHRNKYINNSVSHMLDSKGDAWDQITDCFSYEDKKEFNKVYRELKEYADTETKQKSIEEARKYLLSNWDGIVIYNTEQAIKGCSAEGHVSHVYASRMSSRPLGWSRKGTDRMSRLRIYYYNGGKMLDLVRNQKQELQKVAGGEELYSCSDILQSERKKRKETERYVENMTYRLPYPEIKKKMNLQEHIWRL